MHISIEQPAVWGQVRAHDIQAGYGRYAAACMDIESDYSHFKAV